MRKEYVASIKASSIGRFYVPFLALFLSLNVSGNTFCLPHGRPGSGQCDGQDLGGGTFFCLLFPTTTLTLIDVF